jgi:hypothetical protein
MYDFEFQMYIRGRRPVSPSIIARHGRSTPPRGTDFVVIVGVFVKKTQQAPRREIDLALSRAKEVLP